MTYDHWKTTPPDDWYGYPDDEAPECEHEEYDLDILTGRADCFSCDHHWYLTDAQMTAHEQQQHDYDRLMAREQTWWWRSWQWLRCCPLQTFQWLRRRTLNWRLKYAPRTIGFDDDIPF